jgi:hypothetical protein
MLQNYVDEANAFIFDPFYSNDLLKTLRLVPMIVGEYALAYYCFFLEHDTKEEKQVREYKRVLTTAQMTQALRWDEATEEEKDKQEEGVSEKTDEKKKSPPSAQSLFDMLFDSTEDKHITAFGIAKDDEWYALTMSLFKERINTEIKDALLNTKKARKGAALEEGDDAKVIADFSDGRKLAEVVELAKDKIAEHFGRDFVDAAELNRAKQYVDAIGVAQVLVYSSNMSLPYAPARTYSFTPTYLAPAPNHPPTHLSHPTHPPTYHPPHPSTHPSTHPPIHPLITHSHPLILVTLYSAKGAGSRYTMEAVQASDVAVSVRYG